MKHRYILFPEKYAVYYCAKFTPKLQQKSFFSDFSRLLLKNLIKAVFIDVKFEKLQKKFDVVQSKLLKIVICSKFDCYYTRLLTIQIHI